MVDGQLADLSLDDPLRDNWACMRRRVVVARCLIILESAVYQSASPKYRGAVRHKAQTKNVQIRLKHLKPTKIIINTNVSNNIQLNAYA